MAADDPGLTIVHPNAGGIDVGNESHFVAVPADRDAHRVREWGCWTADMKRMAEWLKACRIDTVAMQATGVYSIALDGILTQHGIRVVLVNAQHTKNVPGRTSVDPQAGPSPAPHTAIQRSGHGQAWVDRGAAKFEQRRKELELASLNSRALAKGFKLVPLPH